MIYIRTSVVFFEGLVSDETLGEGLDRSLDNMLWNPIYFQKDYFIKQQTPFAILNKTGV